MKMEKVYMEENDNATRSQVKIMRCKDVKLIT